MIKLCKKVGENQLPKEKTNLKEKRGKFENKKRKINTKQNRQMVSIANQKVNLSENNFIFLEKSLKIVEQIYYNI